LLSLSVAGTGFLNRPISACGFGYLLPEDESEKARIPFTKNGKKVSFRCGFATKQWKGSAFLVEFPAGFPSRSPRVSKGSLWSHP
jgi:hypothetical protein